VAGENNDNSSERPTALMQRDALLGLIDRTAERDAPLAHTVPRERLRSRAPTREELAALDIAPLSSSPRASDPELDADLSPPMSPLLVLAVIAVLVVTFIAVARMS
jgi:hypothetical protein